MSWYKTAKEVSNEYSWTYVNLPSKIVDTLIEFGKEIDPDDLYTKEADSGVETDPHITVKYALITNEFKDVKDLLKGEKGGKFYLGKSSIFENDKFDVVKIDVESNDLLRLHEKLNYLPHEDKHPEFHAHATIAYVKPGKGKKYVGKFKIDKSFSFDELFFGDQDKKDHKINLAFNVFNRRHKKKIVPPFARSMPYVSKKAQTSYLDIGHHSSHILWVSFDGVNVIKSDPSRFEDHANWDKFFSDDRRWSGRYEIDAGKLSVSGDEARGPSNTLMNNLMAAFPDVKTIYVFNRFDKTTETIRVAKRFNLFQYRYAQIWNVDMRDDGIEDKIAALYELEYKYSMVRDRFQGHPERQANILRELESRLNNVLEEVKDILINVFGEWLSKHALLSADTWASGRAKDTNIDDIGVEGAYRGMLFEYVRYAIYKGQGHYPIDPSAYERFFREMLNEAKKNLSQYPVFSKVLESGLRDYKEMLRNDLAATGFKEFGRNWNKKLRNEEQAENFIERLKVKDVDPDSLFYSEGISGFAQAVENMGYAEEVLQEFYKNFVFPHWVNYWMAMGIEQTRENIEDIYKKLQQINPNDIKNALVTVNLAINTSHQTGDMLDYISEYSSGSGSSREMKSFLDEMSSGSKAEEWNKELREIGVNI